MASSGYSYGHASQPSYSFHNHSASSATPRHNHTHSAASIHDGAHDHDLKEELVTSAEDSREQVYVDAKGRRRLTTNLILVMKSSVVLSSHCLGSRSLGIRGNAHRRAILSRTVSQ